MKTEQAVFTASGERVLTAGIDGTVRLWDATTGNEVYRFAGHKGAVHGVACLAGGRKAVSCGQDGTVRRLGVAPVKRGVQQGRDG